jgi:hypothetical protein
VGVLRKEHAMATVSDLRKRIVEDPKFRQDLIASLRETLQNHGFKVSDEDIAVKIPTDFPGKLPQDELAWRVAVGPKQLVTIMDF